MPWVGAIFRTIPYQAAAVELDARSAPEGTTLSADVCIVGAGPVGLSLAYELQATGAQVLLLESGGYHTEAQVEELDAGEVSGDPYQDLRLSRCRRIGGTAAIWNTRFNEAAYAKYVPLDEIDFERRDWIASSGWPFQRAELDPYYRRAHSVCGLGPFDYSGTAWSDEQHHMLSFGRAGLTSGVYLYGPAERFTHALPRALAAASGALLVHGATVTELCRAAEGGIREIRWASLTGRRGTARASNFVLAGGGIENPRLLLLSGIRSRWLGCGFMEHPIDSSLELDARASELTPGPGFYSLLVRQTALPAFGRIGLSAELLRSEKLRNASLRLSLDEEPRLLQSDRLRPAARRAVPYPPLRRAIGRTIRSAGRLAGRFRATRYRVLIDLEQGPHPENRIFLTERQDALGRPQASLHWRWRREDQTNLERLRVLVARELERAGAGKVRVIGEQAPDPNAHHHAGTTRMHPDPERGVVDEQLRFHGIENLFVAGASVFPTAGFANPTLTSIALALRLADHLAMKR